MDKCYVLVIGVCMSCLSVSMGHAQTKVSLEFQAYPTGLISGVRISWPSDAQAQWHVRVGYNWIRHGSAGVHEDERGGGVGATLGYEYLLARDQHGKGLFAGVRCDVWRNIIQWTDRINRADEVSGTTRLVVVQPTVSAGWLLPLGSSWFWVPSLSFGFEKKCADTRCTYRAGGYPAGGHSVGQVIEQGFFTLSKV